MKILLAALATAAMLASPAAAAWHDTIRDAPVRPQLQCANRASQPSSSVGRALTKACELADEYAISEVDGGWASYAKPLRCVYFSPRRDRCWVAERNSWLSNGQLDNHNDLTIVWHRTYVWWIDIFWTGHRVYWSFR